jgi:hypothetical protein
MPLAATAGDWSGPAPIGIARITVRADQTITVVSEAGTFPNPDSCDNATRIILLPPGAPGAVLSYQQVYDLLLGAKLNRRPIRVFLEGCTLFGSETFPVLVEVALQD